MKKVILPKTSERILGASLPKDGIIYVCDYDEVFKIVIGELSEPDIIDDDPYVFLEKLSMSLGVYENPSILESNGNSISYKFDSYADFVTVEYNINGTSGKLEFRTLSGDWFAASFSECGSYLILAEPYDLELYEL